MTAQRNGNSEWSLVALDELCEPVIPTRDPRNRENELFTYVDISSVDATQKQIVQPKQLLGREASSRARQIIRGNDVLVATTRPNLNAVAAVPHELDGQIASTGFCILRARSELDPEYLFVFVQSPYFVRDLSRLVKGALYPAVTENQVRAQKIPLPPLEEQQRIAARLREQLSISAEARSALEAQLADVRSLILAYVREDSRDAGPNLQPIADLLVEVTEGIGDSWRDQPVLGATRAGLAPAKEPVGKRPERYKPVRAGTIFYNPMRILLGSIAIVDEGDSPGITSPDYVVMRGREGVLHPVWFYHWFRSPAGAVFIKSLSRGAVRERLLFNRLARGHVTIPSWERQLRAVDRIRAATKLCAILEAKLAALEKLPAALLRQAFSGGSKR